MFEKVLIANRGEIALRILRACREMGIKTVAVHSTADEQAMHVRLADESVCIGPPPSRDSYLNIPAILSAATITGAEAIHPGYGFLSENSGFARAVEAAGLVFIGPAPDTIDLMGDKIRSRRFAEENGVPVAPSVTGGEDIDDFVEKAASIGFPLLIKASAGGGGKGMSIVEGKQDLLTRARTARSEAERYFGDPTIYAERYVERPRHIEVQVLGDGQGKVLHLFERDCSVQRRFQKIIEEAPAGHLDPALRDEICAAAVRLSEAVAYRNAGTVEFILAPDGTFYFLEMNTRLQVEHPVTEMVTGLDLVALQLDIAAGRGLSLDQPDITLTGHALECRVCAEVPEQDFMPATGRILHLDPPAGDNIRFENGLREGADVTLDFDSMLAKLVVAAPDRPAAIAAAQQALERTVLLGVETNINYLARILSHPAFRDDPLHTGFVAEHQAALAEPDLSPHEAARVLMAAALTFREFRTLAFDAPEPYASIGGWRN